MRKVICLLLVVLMSCLFVLSAAAAPEGPEITLQPQSPNYPEYSVAIYTVKAEGTNLTATWYMEWLGKTYTISNIGGSMQAWEPYAGEAYGARKLDDHTFAFIFEGIEYDLDGAYIWCVLEDGHYDVTSQKARISVGNSNTPPEIVSIPAQLTVEQGEEAEIRCVAKSPDASQLSFLWYETDTGRMEDMRAVNRGTETSDYMFCDTSNVGTRNYLCLVETSNGGLAYSSIVHVTVTEKIYYPDPPSIQTNALPEAQVGKEYSARIVCSDPEAEFLLYYNPGASNDFEKSGLVLGKDGTISGIPKTAGEFSFSVCAANAGGEDYMNYTISVKAAPAESPTEPVDTPEAPSTEEEETSNTENPTKPEKTKRDDRKSENEEASDTGVPWWALVLIGVAAAGVGAGTAIVLIKKKS